MWLVSFGFHIRTKQSTRNDGIVKVGNLPVEETNQARLGVNRVVQKQVFVCIMQAGNWSRQRSLRNLCPVVVDNLLRIDGWLARTSYLASFKHQVILSNRHQITDRIIAHYQIKEGHVGTSFF